MKLIDGKAHAKVIYDNLRKVIKTELPVIGRPPHLVIFTSADPASRVYVDRKIAACKKHGIYCEPLPLYSGMSYEEQVKAIDAVNCSDVDGCIIQLPAADGIDVDMMLSRLDPKKDVDGLTPYNRGELFTDRAYHEPCTPAGIVHMLAREGVSFSGKSVAIIGRSILVGHPLADIFTRLNATVTLCHSRTRNLSEITRQADIVVAAVGKPAFLTCDMIKPGAIVVDVGINRVNGELCGDCAADLGAKASLWTPVPGGVGPMTVAMLLSNTVEAWRLNNARAI